MDESPVLAVPGRDSVSDAMALFLGLPASPGCCASRSCSPSSDPISVMRDEMMLGGPDRDACGGLGSPSAGDVDLAVGSGDAMAAGPEIKVLPDSG